MRTAGTPPVAEPRFWFEEVAPFKAHGLRRCQIPGCGISGTDYGQMNADFWRDRQQQVVVRFTWAGWTYHFRAVLAGGGQIPDTEMESFLECVQDLQHEWLGEAPDCAPEVPMSPEPE